MPKIPIAASCRRPGGWCAIAPPVPAWAGNARGEDGVRVDDGVEEGGEVSIFYDPMIAKLVTWGATRDEAADKQIAALDRFEIEGLGHNIDFVSAIMQHPRFRSGELTTGFIAEEYPDGFHGAATEDHIVRALAAIAGFMATRRGRPRAAHRRPARRPARSARQVAGHRWRDRA